ncbi:hypothetical protein [Anaeromassilibacillus senegalensis]|uniref:hypothetical protein n=1 Tax=Anaeromassilibacillus senegalensis TaxID=1673717 RepID=UPI0012B5F404|nr:hypothetical protein [Anaeromassilibacillus senegalensis]
MLRVDISESSKKHGRNKRMPAKSASDWILQAFFYRLSQFVLPAQGEKLTTAHESIFSALPKHTHPAKPAQLLPLITGSFIPANRSAVC